ncbi:glycosyltransferase [Archaeoglobus neptunius]|uniref:glycosyltransferase n=1 Tax=Archaeoglobus neptunius TaxID=2798580 RepID=UPI0019266EFB|nr:glycosyltransferase family 2 protein [Archaeoglobus neptunius]
MKTLVVILNKDNAEGLKACVDSLISQTVRICEDFDVLVLDGGSSDLSEEVVRELSLPCVIFKVQERLGGTGYARVEACDYALKRGYDVVIWGDSENVYFPDYVEKMLEALKSADAVGGKPVVRGGFFAHAFAWYHAIHAIIPRLVEKHIPGNNKAERVEVFRTVMYPESRRAEDYGFSLVLMKRGIKLRQKLADARVFVSLPESWRGIFAWQRARAIGASEAAHEAGVFPADGLIWMPALIPFFILPVFPLLSLLLISFVFIFSLFIFYRSRDYLESPKKRYFFAPFVGILIHSAYTFISLLHYIKLKIF